MELELGLKITHSRDDVTSFTDLRITKDHFSPLFMSTENEDMFFLIGYLKGFRRENIGIKISEDGSRIEIRGEKPVQEIVLMGLIMHKKDVELKAFIKAFVIPEGIILDRIKAKFNDEESTLTIVMPKLEKGMRGVGIEEVKEELPTKAEVEKEPKLAKTEENEKIVHNEIESQTDNEPKIENMAERPVGEERESEKTEDVGQLTLQKEPEMEEKQTIPEKIEPPAPASEAAHQEMPKMEAEEIKPAKINKRPHTAEQTSSKETKSEQTLDLKQETPEAENVQEQNLENHDQNAVSKKLKLCPPLVVAGSAVIVSFVVLVINLIRDRRK